MDQQTLLRDIRQKFGSRILFMESLYSFGAKTIHECMPQIQNRSMNDELVLAVLMLNRATTSVLSVVHLFAAGLDVDALAVMRTIAELLIDYSWIFKADTKNRVERYISYQFVIAHELKETFFFSPGSFAGHDAVKEAKPIFQVLDAEYKRVMQKFKYGDGWAPISIKRRANDTGLRVLHEAFYGLGCNASHSNAGSVTAYAKGPLIWRGPRVPDGSIALETASKAFLLLTEKVRDLFSLARNEFDQINARHTQVFSEQL